MCAKKINRAAAKHDVLKLARCFDLGLNGGREDLVEAVGLEIPQVEFVIHVSIGASNATELRPDASNAETSDNLINSFAEATR